MSTLSHLLSLVTEPLGYTFIQRALLSCALIGFTNGFLGTFIILRRQALLADALSHSLLPGLAVAAILVGLSPGGLLLGGLVAALLVALGGQLMARNSRLKDETAIASLYMLTLFDSTVARASGIKVGWIEAGLLTLTVLGLVASLQAVGVLLSLGLLILPAATAYLLTDSFTRMLWGGAFLGLISSVGGLFLSFYANIPSGPCIVLLLAILLGIAYLVAPRHGILPKLLRGHHFHEESLERWEGHQGHDHDVPQRKDEC